MSLTVMQKVNKAFKSRNMAKFIIAFWSAWGIVALVTFLATL